VAQLQKQLATYAEKIRQAQLYLARAPPHAPPHSTPPDASSGARSR
jgi:hypothetical protein